MDNATAVAALAALAQESRLAVYRLLVEAGPTGLSVGEIGAAVRIAPATLSFHLKELSRAGLVTARQEGRFIFYAANFAEMNALLGFLTDHCCARDGLGCDSTSGESCCSPPGRARRGKPKASTKEK